MTHPPLPLSARSKRVLAGTQGEADTLRHYWIDIDHLLLGLLKEGGPAAQALLAQGWSSETIRQTAIEARQRYPQKRIPLIRGLLFQSRLSQETIRLVLLALLALALLAAILFLHMKDGL